MGINFSNFSIRGIDVSQFNGTIDWSKVIAHFSAVRVGYGRTIDNKFKVNWAGAKGKVKRIPYWYLDFYSNHMASSTVYGTSDVDWGKAQAVTCWNALKNDPEGIVFLDIENTNVKGVPEIMAVTGRAQTIAMAFLQEMDRLNGKTNGIYCSLGLLSWFADWFRDRPLWVAWYNEAQTAASVLAAVRAKGWHGPVVIWQYASHGDVNADGVADGISMGMQYGFLDLNALLGGEESCLIIWGVVIAVETPEEPVITEPVVEEEPDTGEYPEYIVRVPCLMLRSKPFVSASTLIGRLYLNLPLKISKTVEVDGRIWGRVATQGWWCCLEEGGNVYAERVE